MSTIISDHAYSYRIDYNMSMDSSAVQQGLISEENYRNNFINSTIVEWMRQRQECVLEYMFALEVKTNGQRHFQGIVWTTNKLTDRQAQQFRNVKQKSWVNKVNGSRGYRPVSFTKAKNIGSLAKYCNNKEGLGLVVSNGITEDVLKKIGQWIYNQGKQKQEDIINIYKKRFKDIYQGYIEGDVGFLGNYNDPLYDNRDHLRRIIFELAYDVWKEHDKRPPRKQHLIPMLHSILVRDDYLLLQYSL
jgi:hypothetical protein